jgi:hypothetical protein
MQPELILNFDISHRLRQMNADRFDNYLRSSVFICLNLRLISNPVASELIYYPQPGHGLALVPTINRCRETALPCPLYHSGATGIDMKMNQPPATAGTILTSSPSLRAVSVPSKNRISSLLT